MPPNGFAELIAVETGADGLVGPQHVEHLHADEFLVEIVLVTEPDGVLNPIPPFTPDVGLAAIMDTSQSDEASCTGCYESGCARCHRIQTTPCCLNP